MENLIEIYISPNGDHLWEVANSPIPGDGFAESLSVAKHLLSELRKMGKGKGEGAGAGKSKTGMRRRCARRPYANVYLVYICVLDRCNATLGEEGDALLPHVCTSHCFCLGGLGEPFQNVWSANVVVVVGGG